MPENIVFEKIGAMDAKVTAAHSRLDKLETVIREDLRELKDELKFLTAHMNQSKGWSAALMFLAGTFGAGFIKLISIIFKI